MEGQESSTDSSIPASDSSKFPLSTIDSSSQDASTEQAGNNCLSSTSVEPEKVENVSIPQVNSPVLMFGNGSSVKGSVKSAHFEFGERRLSVETEMISDLDSGESTNNMNNISVEIAIEQTDEDTHEHGNKGDSCIADEKPNNLKNKNIFEKGEETRDFSDIENEYFSFEKGSLNSTISEVLQKRLGSVDKSRTSNSKQEHEEEIRIKISTELSISGDLRTDIPNKTKNGQEESDISLNIPEPASDKNI